ncbi:MAG: hypothetical protein V4850_24200 [Myxococcota bacterium]|jgi:hypothetical protein
MKIAGGCFGCLALVFLALSLTWGVIYGAIASAEPGLASDLAVLSVPIQYGSSACCCLSGVLAIVLLVAGSMGKKTEEYE